VPKKAKFFFFDTEELEQAFNAFFSYISVKDNGVWHL